MKVVNKYKESFTHYVGRGSIFGNPFVIGRDEDRQAVISKYRKYAKGNKELIAAIVALPPDAILGCFCKPKPCHGDVIIDIWNEYN